MADSRDIEQLIRDEGFEFEVKPVEIGEDGFIIDGNTRHRAARQWQLDVAANLASQSADTQPELDPSGADSQTVIHACQRAGGSSHKYTEYRVAEYVMVSGCLEHQHINTRFFCAACKEAYERLLNTARINPHCRKCSDPLAKTDDYIIEKL